ncbi:hypothetical protein H3Z83_04430 [Tenacibaculum sp. S7007]|uniref:Uncharacterized protein n=1 Tax=Tenacibaculum pelagium TaxID=2759527 RepID=A0A839AN25_9FLAO|nr:hypothetical protein [Tenacibaculum pelagium]MBA6155770.1 hypothetical protein [Tenacibaculum pelagium]
MSFSENIKKSLYWGHVLKMALFLIIIISLFSLIFQTGGALFSGDFDTVYNVHFANKQWVRFFLTKIVVSILYAMYVVNKRMK